MSFLRINKQERVLRITLNRPDKRNALTTAMCHELVDAVESIQDNAAIGSVLIDAEGRAFCAGMDLDEAVADKTQNSIAIHEKLFSSGAHIAEADHRLHRGPRAGRWSRSGGASARCCCGAGRSVRFNGNSHWSLAVSCLPFRGSSGRSAKGG